MKEKISASIKKALSTPEAREVRRNTVKVVWARRRIKLGNPREGDIEMVKEWDTEHAK